MKKNKTESSAITVEGQTPILGLSKNNWNFLYEEEDFEMSLLGNISPAKKKMYDEPVTEQNILSEPEVVYKKRTLETFSSFEEANEADAQAMAQLSPEEHLKNATERIQKIFEDELKKTMDKKIKFRK